MLNSVTVNRSRRPNAGSRMARLLNEEEEDDFYTNAYGGFAEEEDDYDYESESSGRDSIDSDFVETEEDVDGSGNEATGVVDSDDEKKRRRTRRVITKGYKEPPRPKKKEASDKVKPEPKSRVKLVEEASTDVPSEGRRLRASTVRAQTETAAGTRRQAAGDSEVTALKRKALLAEIAQRKNLPEVRRLTQEELLAEAKITEEINKRSLARYQRLEIERKKIRVQKTASQQPMICTHSFTVPSVADQPEVYGVSINAESGDVEMRQMLVNRNSRCSRTVVSFSDPASFSAVFPSTGCSATGKRLGQAPRRKTRICPLTGRVAAYLDPLTRTPYADLAAFRALRYLYRLHLETGTSAIDLLRQYRSRKLIIKDD